MLFYIFTLIFNINEAIVGNNDSTTGAGVPVKDDDLLHETLLEIYGVLTSDTLLGNMEDYKSYTIVIKFYEII
jgi:hypothetical protein